MACTCNQYVEDHYAMAAAATGLAHGAPWPGCPLDRLARQRHQVLDHQLTPQLVLLVDHPDRLPLSRQANQSQRLNANL